MGAARLKAPIIVETPPPSGCHAIERAWERYGTRLNFADIGTIVGLIQENHGKLVSHTPGESSEWLLVYKDTEYRVVMDPTFWRVLTFLPPRRARVQRRRKLIYKNKIPKWVSSSDL